MKKLLTFFAFLLTVAGIASLSSCKDYEDEITYIHHRIDSLDSRVTKVEKAVNQINIDIRSLQIIAQAAERGLYITSVITTLTGYEITLSDNTKLTLNNGSDGQAGLTPVISLRMIDGVYYWTLNGELMLGEDGQPVRASGKDGKDGKSPLVKIDPETYEWLIAVDGVNFQHTDVYAQVVINDKVLYEIINNYISKNSDAVISDEILFQIISRYIEKNYSVLFNTEVLNKLISNYIEENISQLVSNETLTNIINKYIEENATSIVDNEKLAEILLKFLQENTGSIITDDVLNQLILAYVRQNTNLIFDEAFLSSVINSYIETHKLNLIDDELIGRIIKSYLENNHDAVITNELLQDIISKYLKANFFQLISNDMLQQIVNSYLQENAASLFNEELLRKVILDWVADNYALFINDDQIKLIINRYIENNQTLVFDEKVLYDVLYNYLKNNSTTLLRDFIDEAAILEMIRSVINSNPDKLVNEDVIRSILIGFIEKNYESIFNVDLMQTIINRYLEQNTTLITRYIDSNSLITSVTIENDKAIFGLRDRSPLTLVIYDAFASVRDRVQSIVYVPDYEDGQISLNDQNQVELKYMVTPSSMAQVIASAYQSNKMKVGIVARELATRAAGDALDFRITKLTAKDGELHVKATAPFTSTSVPPFALALSVQDLNDGGSDYMTTFTPLYTGYNRHYNYNFTFTVNGQTKVVPPVDNFMTVSLKEGEEGEFSVVDEKGNVPNFYITGNATTYTYSIQLAVNAAGQQVVHIAAMSGAMLDSPKNFTLNLFDDAGKPVTSYTVSVQFSNN